MEKSYIYLLIHKDWKKFKIWKANDLQRRVCSLNSTWKGFNLKESFSVETSIEYVHKLEKTLHNLIIEYSYLIEEKLDWYTEFFNIEWLSYIIKVIENIPKKKLIIRKWINLKKIKENDKLKNRKKTSIINEDKGIYNDKILEKFNKILEENKKNIWVCNYDFIILKNISFNEKEFNEEIIKILFLHFKWGVKSVVWSIRNTTSDEGIVDSIEIELNCAFGKEDNKFSKYCNLKLKEIINKYYIKWNPNEYNRKIVKYNKNFELLNKKTPLSIYNTKTDKYFKEISIFSIFENLKEIKVVYLETCSVLIFQYINKEICFTFDNFFNNTNVYNKEEYIENNKDYYNRKFKQWVNVIKDVDREYFSFLLKYLKEKKGISERIIEK